MANIVYRQEGEPTPYKPAVWNPLDFCATYEAHKPEIPIDFIDESIGRAVTRLPKRLPEFRFGDRIVGMEVGDDRVDLSHNPYALSLMLDMQESVLGMKTSEADTYISDHDWNFCEVTSWIPRSPEGSLDYARKNDFSNLEFIDSPTLRIIIDVQKADRSHSSTVPGKASLLGARCKTPRTECMMRLQIASWFQDACLNTRNSNEPKYLTKVLGGSGCPPLFQEVKNSYFYHLVYKDGSYRRVYGTAIREALNCVTALDRGEPANALMCQRLRDKQKYLHATYAGHTFLAPQGFKPLDTDDTIQPIYRAAGSQAFIHGMENRLVQSRTLITKKAAEIEMMRTNRIILALFGVSNIKVSNRLEVQRTNELRKMYEGALNANSAIQRLLSRSANGREAETLIAQGFLYAGTNVLDLSYNDLSWCESGGTAGIYSIQDLTTTDDMYIRREVSIEETLRVGGIPLHTILNNRRSIANRTRAEIGLWQMSEEKIEWADRVVRELSNARAAKGSPLVYREILPIFYANREWVADDTLLVGMCIEDSMQYEQSAVTTVLLISKDRKLAKNMCRSSGNNVIMIRPGDVVHLLDRDKLVNGSYTLEDLQADMNIRMFNCGVPEPRRFYIDRGSVDAALVKTEQYQQVPGKPAYQKTLQGQTFELEGRTAVVELKALAANAVFPVSLLAANDQEKTVVPNYIWDPVPRQSFRFSGVMARFARGAKGGR